MNNLKNKIKTNLKNNKYVWLTIGISTFLFLIIYALKSIIPIGKNTLLTVDFYHQYGPLLAELYDKVMAGDNLIYSFSTGLGLPFFRNFYNYLSSPFNIIMFLFNRENIVTAFSIIIALKIITASAIMTYFLNKFFNKNSITTTIFGLSYAFSSYFVAFYWNIMWLDGLIFLPLVILGIKKLIDENKINLYILSLFLSILANYFITYMICLFACLFFIIYIIFKNDLSRKELIKKILLFTISSLIAGGLAGFMLLPYVSSLSSISATGDSFTFYKNFNFNPLYFLANHFSLVNSIVFSSQEYYLPNISSGIAIFVLLIAFFFNSNIKLKNKLMITIFIFFLFISFLYVPLDFIWHGFHTPNDLPFRFSFIYVFIINIVAFYSLNKINFLKIRYALIIFGLVIISLFYLEHINFLSNFAFEVNMLILLIMLTIFITYKFNHSNTVKYILLFIIFSDIILNINENWSIDHNKNTFMDNYVSAASAIESVKERDNSFYRIEKSFNQTLNDGAWYNYNGISVFSSVAYEQMAKNQKELGMPGNNVNSYYYKQNTPIYNSIMSVKYLIGLENQNRFYEQIDTINYYEIYRNKYFLPLAFAVSKNIKNWSNDNFSPFLNQQDFVQKATGIDDILVKLPLSNDDNQNNYNLLGDIVTNLNFEETNRVIININTLKNSNVYLYVYNYDLNSFIFNNKHYAITTNEPYVVDAGYFEKNKEAKLEFYLNSNISNVIVLAYQMDSDKFEQFYQTTNNNALQITNFNNSLIEGVMEVDNDKTVFTSLNFDEGLKVYIDDKKVETFKIANSFLGFDINSGTHNIKIIYKIPKLKMGVFISSLSLGLLILINIIKKKKKH